MKEIVIVGGGAAGFFAAISAGEAAIQKKIPVKITILETSGDILKKVRISGGGRCNVTHHIFETRPFCAHYPRGGKELLSAMEQFQARDTVEWFANHGVRLVPEKDGRMFPDTNDSQTVIDCFLKAAADLGILILKNHPVQKIERSSRQENQTDPSHIEHTFILSIANKDPIPADAVMIATGSAPKGYSLAQGLGHTLTDLAPSLFSFKITNPLLITHWGLSGPAILKLSSWAARAMKKVEYQAKLVVNWLGKKRVEEVKAILQELKETNAKGQIGNSYPEELAKRFWLGILVHCQVSESKRWADLTAKEMTTLSECLYGTTFEILGKNRYKDEFVECGGIALNEINFKKMESKICPGLFFGGEVLDIDGLTGGFNFQAAWTAGAIAGANMV